MGSVVFLKHHGHERYFRIRIQNHTNFFYPRCEVSKKESVISEIRGVWTLVLCSDVIFFQYSLSSWGNHILTVSLTRITVFITRISYISWALFPFWWIPESIDIYDGFWILLDYFFVSANCEPSREIHLPKYSWVKSQRLRRISWWIFQNENVSKSEMQKPSQRQSNDTKTVATSVIFFHTTLSPTKLLGRLIT